MNALTKEVMEGLDQLKRQKGLNGQHTSSVNFIGNC